MSKIRRKKIKTSEWLFGLYRFRVEIEGTIAHILKSGGGNVESSRERESRGWVGDGVLSSTKSHMPF